MSTTIDTTSPSSLHTAAPSDSERAWVLWEWCLRRETGRWLPQLMLLVPLVLLETLALFELTTDWHPNQGRNILNGIYVLAALVIVGGGTIHAAQAVCWEMSPELRELVRLTGAQPLPLLFCRTLSRWLTVGVAVLLLAPMVCFARCLGGATWEQLCAIGLALFMLATLTAAFALVAGLSATDAQNPAMTAAMGTFILLLLYHTIFWLASPLVFIARGLTTGDWSRPPFEPWWQACFDFGWQSTPIAVLISAARTPDLLSPLSPSYWLHFVAAFFAMRWAARVMIHRFQSSVTRQDSESVTAPTGTRAAPARPRCSELPLLWKDAEILAGGARGRRRWNIAAVVIAIGIVAINVANSDWHSAVPLAVLTLCALPIIYAVRVDALIAAEFRQQTWQSLMLLPIGRQSLYWTKLRAIARQQRWMLLPAAVALAFGCIEQPVALGMATVIAPIAGLLLCQVSAVYYFTRHEWWRSPIHAFLAVGLIMLCLVIWFNFPPWVSFFMTLLLLAVSYIPIQHYIGETLQDWTEP